MREVLTTLFGEAVTDESFAKFSTELGKKFVAKGDFNTKLKDLETANTKILEYEGKIKDLETEKDDAVKLNEKIRELQEEIEARNAAEAEKEAEKALLDRFGKAAGEKKFLNDFTRSGLFNEFKAAVKDEANAGKADNELFAALTKDRDNIFIPDGGIPSAVSSTQGSQPTSDDDVRAIMGLPPLK